MLKNFQIVGHRGFRSQYPENTLISFRKALEFGLTALEFDVHSTKDGRLVVTHDPSVERCSNGKGLVNDFTFEEIRKLDFGGWKDPSFAGTQIPTLEETLDCIYSVNPSAYLLVELKDDDEECTKKTYEVLQRYGVLKNGLILSFRWRQLMLLRKMDPAVYLQGFPYRYLQDPAKNLYQSTFNKVCIWTKEATNAEIADFHKMGIAVDICPVDTEEQFLTALKLDCDSITTNSPDVILPLLKKYNISFLN